MPLIAVVSDIHGNLPALEAVMSDADAEGATGIWCLGDTVGYGPDPGRCVRVLRARDAACVMGNHDAATIGKIDTRWFNGEARIAIQWSESDLADDEWGYVAQLPDRLEPGYRCQLVHGSPDDRSRYLITRQDLAAQALLMQAEGSVDVCFFGHTHLPVVASASRDWRGDERLYNLATGGPYLVNPGSVGQPRDADPRASYLLWDPQSRWARFRRVAYDITRAQARIIDAGLPRGLAERLGVGL